MQVRPLREHPPSSYSIKFENLSQLSDERYESRLFVAGGYEWRLVIYPKGNAKDEGSGFISMYVEIDSTNLMSTPLTDVFAYLIFFVYNKKTDKYFTIKDTEVKRFNVLRTVWGLSQVLPLEIFNDPKNGYIFDGDQCEFGVDVLVAPPLTKWEVVSFNKKTPNPTFSWILKKFKELKESEKSLLLIGGRKWILQLYPKGSGIAAAGKWLSMTLYLPEAPNADEKIYMRAVLRIVDPRGAATHIAEKIKYCFTKRNTIISWDAFAPLDKLREAYLDKDGSLNVEIEIEDVSTTQYSPSI